MSAPDHAFAPLSASNGAASDNTVQAEWILWQEFQQGYLTGDQLAHTLEVLEPERQQEAFAHFLSTRSDERGSVPDAVFTAQAAIWHLFDAGLIDDNSATVALLAIYVGLQRTSSGRGGATHP